jgi:hypothetical protein
MKTIKISEGFEGYPDGRTLRTFQKNEEAEVPKEFADLAIEKGLAKEVPTRRAAPREEKGSSE